MPRSWDSYERSQETPDACPECGKGSNKSPKVAPFCSVGHRGNYLYKQKKLWEERYVASMPGAGELADNAGRICRIREVKTTEVRGRSKGKVRFDTIFYFVCGDQSEAPEKTDAVAVTCIGCISAT